MSNHNIKPRPFSSWFRTNGKRMRRTNKFFSDLEENQELAKELISKKTRNR